MTATKDMQVHTPRSTANLHAVMRELVAAGEPLRISGADTWSNCGAPVTATHVLSLRELTGITEYVPGDLTITARAGTSLAELSQATAAAGQWLGLDPAGSRHGTIGATIATASSGPLSHAYGTPRDLVLGIEAVTGYGDVVRPGGRVVKNVAGFDLVRLYTGAWGTLGPLTSVTLRLRALPVHDVTLAISLDHPARLDVVLPLLRANTVSLLAAEWIDRHTAAAIGLGADSDAILVRIGGNDPFVRGQQVVLDRIADNEPCDPAVWGALSTQDTSAAAVLRLSGAVSELPARIDRVRSALAATGATFSLHASLGRGTIRVIAHDAPGVARAVLQHVAPREQRIVERLPAAWWNNEADPFTGGVAERIRHAFDPQLLCNRRMTPHA